MLWLIIGLCVFITEYVLYFVYEVVKILKYSWYKHDIVVWQNTKNIGWGLKNINKYPYTIDHAGWADQYQHYDDMIQEIKKNLWKHKFFLWKLLEFLCKSILTKKIKNFIIRGKFLKHSSWMMGVFYCFFKRPLTYINLWLILFLIIFYMIKYIIFYDIKYKSNHSWKW